MRRYLRDPTFSRFDTIPECDGHTHTHTQSNTRRRHIPRLARRRAVIKFIQPYVQYRSFNKDAKKLMFEKIFVILPRRKTIWVTANERKFQFENKFPRSIYTRNYYECKIIARKRKLLVMKENDFHCRDVCSMDRRQTMSV